MSSIRNNYNVFDMIDEMLRNSAEIADALDMSAEEFIERASTAFCDVRCEEVVNCEITLTVRNKPEPS